MTSQRPAIPATARALAAELASLFAKDQELAHRLNDAQSRLRDANERLWTGLHPDALALLYEATAGIPTRVPSHSHVTAVMLDQLRDGADERQLGTAVLAAVQEIHWAIHRAFVDYQSAYEDRRQLGIDGGELGQCLVDALVTAGWTDAEARTADVHHLAEAAATMSDADHDPLDETFARARDRRARFTLWLQHLRARDPTFAEASARYPDDMGEWQAAVYLLTGCDKVWGALAKDVLADVSMAPVIAELEHPRRAWSSSEHSVMRWSAHFWDIDRWPAQLPYVFEHYYFQRWITACHLYKRIPPALTTTDGSAPCR